MVFIFGVRNRQKMKKPMVVTTCKGCGKESLKHIMKADTCGTIFLAPVIVFNSKYYIACPECGTFEKISKEKYKAIKLLCKTKEGYIFMKNVEKFLQTGEKTTLKDNIQKDIEEIFEKLKGINHKIINENKERLKKSIKENLNQKHRNSELVNKTVDEYFENIK